MSETSSRRVRADSVAPTAEIGPDGIRALLRCVPILQGVPRSCLDDLARHCTWIDVSAGTRFIEQGAPGDALFIVLKGRLTVHQSRDGRPVLLGELRRNQAFGERAVLEDRTRSASVIAEEDSRLLGVGRDAFQAFLERNADVGDQIRALAERRRAWADRQRYRPTSATLLEILARMTAVSDGAALQGLEHEVEWVTVPAGVALMRSGEPGEHVFFLVSGALEVGLRRADGSRVPVARIESGDIVGEIALLTDRPRTADVVAADDAELLRLSRRGYEALVAAHPAAMAVFSRKLARRLVGQLEERATVARVASMPLPTEAECRAIVDTPDLVLRNLRITQMYHRLSTQLAALLGSHDANWCTFATHASKTAGNAIRKEELPGYGIVLALEHRFAAGERLLRAVDAAIERAARRLGLLTRIDGITQHVSDCISAGNLKVFAELGPLFAAFLRTFQDGTDTDPTALDELTAVLEPGDSAAGGQQILAEAFRHYVDAMFEPDARRKAELLLLGNCKIGLHEQTRLQPYIVEALDTPMEDLLDPARRHAISSLAEPADDAPIGLRTRVGRWLLRRGRRLMTRYMMRLRLPYGDVSLGRDLPRLPNRRAYPDVLERIESAELRALVGRFDRSTHGLRNSRSVDWGELDDRMNFIVNLFRSRHKSLELFDQPFFYEQRQIVQEGLVPQGRL